MHTSSMNHFWKSKVWEMAIYYLLILAMMTGCMPVGPQEAHAVIQEGMVEAIHYGTVYNGLKAVITEAPRTFMMAKDGLTMLVWSMKQNGWAFVVLSTQNGAVNPLDTWEQVTGGTGNLVNAKDLNGLKECLTGNGWKLVTATGVAESIRTGIAAMAVWSTTVMPTFIITPAGSPLEEILPPAGRDT